MIVRGNFKNSKTFSAGSEGGDTSGARIPLSGVRKNRERANNIREEGGGAAGEDAPGSGTLRSFGCMKHFFKHEFFYLIFFLDSV